MSIICCACTHFEDIQINKPRDKKLAVFSIIYPSDSVFVSVNPVSIIGMSDNKTLFSNDSVVVKISNLKTNSSCLLTLKDSIRNIYAISQQKFPVTKGETYQLTVSAPGFQEVSAQTQVPPAALEPDTIPVPTPYYNNSYGGYMYSLTGRWSSPGNDRFGYKILVLDYGSYYTTTTFISGSDVTQSNNDYTFKYEGHFHSVRGGSKLADSKLDVFLITTDSVFKSFYQANDVFLNIHDYITDGFGLAVLSGFKGIIPPFSNIDNGFGVFGSCVFSQKKTITVNHPQ
ncbi:DUF4249 family protein [Pedobacter sp. HMF7647]|uniref:DUF4249 family protein n=1 Tax=Hufsiella arboris TaxID=2695275 RepID=A0A7K1Y4K9_9SPHI|nr:DUF4249 family protein [Hufsiella arboris]MXV49504.1 DUF4249 family protein [Hufsiella arboris]